MNELNIEINEKIMKIKLVLILIEKINFFICFRMT